MPSSESSRGGPRVRPLAVVLSVGGVLAGLDSSMVNVGLATVGRELGAPLATTQWISSGYLLALAAVLPVSGWLTRRLGAGRLWLWSLAAFTGTSALCATSPDVDLLIAGRIGQGLAGGVLAPAGMIVLAQAVPANRLAGAMVAFSAPAIAAPAVGPVLGAGLIADASWRWLFLVNLPVGAVGLLVALRIVPRGRRTGDAPLDIVALLLASAGLPAVVYALAEAAQRRTLIAPGVALPLAGGLLAVLAWGVRSSSRPSPLLDLGLFRNRVYRAAAVEVALNGAALFGGLTLMPLYFQIVRGRGIVDTGLLLVAFSAGAAAAFPVVGRLTHRYGGGSVAAAGLVLTLLGTVPFALLPAAADLVLVEALQAVRGVGLALSGMPVVATALAAVPAAQVPDASTQVNILSRLGGALGSSLLVVVFTTGLPYGATGSAAVAAFRASAWWLSAAAVGALLGAGWLLRAQRSAAGPRPLAPTAKKEDA